MVGVAEVAVVAVGVLAIEIIFTPIELGVPVEAPDKETIDGINAGVWSTEDEGNETVGIELALIGAIAETGVGMGVPDV